MIICLLLYNLEIKFYLKIQWIFVILLNPICHKKC